MEEKNRQESRKKGKFISHFSGYKTSGLITQIGAGVAQLVSARPSELEVPGSILGDSNVCFDFLLIWVALALNTRKTEHRQRKRGKVRTEGHKFITYLITVTCYPR